MVGTAQKQASLIVLPTAWVTGCTRPRHRKPTSSGGKALRCSRMFRTRMACGTLTMKRADLEPPVSVAAYRFPPVRTIPPCTHAVLVGRTVVAWVAWVLGYSNAERLNDTLGHTPSTYRMRIWRSLKYRGVCVDGGQSQTSMFLAVGSEGKSVGGNSGVICAAMVVSTHCGGGTRR